MFIFLGYLTANTQTDDMLLMWVVFRNIDCDAMCMSNEDTFLTAAVPELQQQPASNYHEMKYISSQITS